jgi:hypothetical protein
MLEKVKRAIGLFCTALYKNTITRSLVLFMVLIVGVILNTVYDTTFFIWLALASAVFLFVQTLFYIIAGIINIIKDIFK